MTDEATKNRSPREHSEAPRRTGSDLRETRILVVDDDPMLLRALTEVVRSRVAGSVVEACRSAPEALEKIDAEDYAVVVSDLMMRGMHGLELLDRIRVVRPTTMVVLITGGADRDLSIRALRGGAYDFIQKPVEPDYLVASIARALETRRLRAEVEAQQETLRRHADELEQTVAHRTDELRRASRSKDEFLATVSHELRTPLTSILGWARLLHNGRLDEGEVTMAIESIARNAQAQAQLIDDLLDVSRIITGKMQLSIKAADLGHIVAMALGVVAPAAQAKGITLSQHVEEGLGPAPGDAHRLQQVFWNLLANAVKFTQPGGHIGVRLARKGASVEIVVHDNGTGIDPQLLPFVFDRFRQGEGSSASRRGLGLGLAIVQHLVELHGGTVTAESKGSGAGATFTVRLPARAPDVELPDKREPSFDTGTGEAWLRGYRVLVVDDEADTREVLRITLVHAGATVEVASSVAEAREAFRREPPDAILCDIGLGREGEDGYALLRALRALPPERGGGVRAVALTGYAKPEDRSRALAAGFDLHVAKPGPPDLPRLLAEILQGGGVE